MAVTLAANVANEAIVSHLLLLSGATSGGSCAVALNGPGRTYFIGAKEGSPYSKPCSPRTL